MKRRSFVGGAFTGVSVTGAFAAPQKLKAGDIPTTTFGKTGVKVSVIAQGPQVWLAERQRLGWVSPNSADAIAIE